MTKYLEIFAKSYSDYWNYLKNEIANPHWTNYFYWVIALSLLVWVLEIFLPWRKNQPIIRKKFWLDAFYILFNFFLFSLIIFNGLSNVAVEAFNDFLSIFHIKNLVSINIASWPIFFQFLMAFIVADFIQWLVHQLFHRVPWMWNFHKVHHSVKEMGFAAQFRFHWMETIIYKSAQYIPLAMIGFGIDDFFIIHIISVAVGHLNHANIGWDYGPLKYIINNPKMHIWHHAKQLPKDRKYGANFGLTLSLWDYLFGTAYIPHNGKDIEIGFKDDEDFPQDFLGQQLRF